MIRRSAAALLVALSTLVAPHAAQAASAKVTYLAGASVYVDAGRLEGVGEGDTLVVTRGTALVARLRVTFLSSHRASCDTFAVVQPIAIGDAVEYRPTLAASKTTAPPPAPASADTSKAAPIPRATRQGPPPVRGRVGIRYLGVRNGALGDFQQPGLDLRLDGTRLGGLPLDLAVDVRAHRSSWSGAADSLALAETRVYRFALDWHDEPGQRRVRVGRQMSGAFSSVSLFDGLLAELGGPRWSAGMFTGTQPRPMGLALSGDILEYGAYVGARSPVGASRRWRMELGGVSSLQQGQPNRDFLFVQGFLQDGRVSGSVTQEVDVNRGWRAENEDALAPTSTFLQSRLQLSESFALRAGFDNRRNVRLYRDRLTPETDFDDRYRLGAWGGATLEMTRYVRVDADYRGRSGSPSERSDTWTGGVELHRLTAINALLRARASRYESELASSDLLSFSFGLDPFAGLHLEASGGSRSTQDAVGGAEERIRWEGLDVDLAIALRGYLVGSWQRDHGELEDMEQLQAGLSWRF